MQTANLQVGGTLRKQRQSLFSSQIFSGFTGWIQKLAHDLQHSPTLLRKGEELKEQFLANDELQDYLFGLWSELARGIEADIDKPDSTIRQQVGQSLQNVAEELDGDPEMQIWVNDWLVNAITLVVSRNSEQIASLISDTVKSWDGADTTRRVELAIGRDLQFIRINGTLVGGLVGLVIYAVILYV